MALVIESAKSQLTRQINSFGDKLSLEVIRPDGTASFVSFASPEFIAKEILEDMRSGWKSAYRLHKTQFIDLEIILEEPGDA